MSEQGLFPEGVRVIETGKVIAGTSRGHNQEQSIFFDAPLILVDFDDGRRDAIPESLLRTATEEDEARSAERIRQTEETNRRAEEKNERIQQRRDESEQIRQQQRAEEAEEAEAARQQANIDYTNEMRKSNARYFGLESLKRPYNEQ